MDIVKVNVKRHPKVKIKGKRVYTWTQKVVYLPRSFLASEEVFVFNNVAMKHLTRLLERHKDDYRAILLRDKLP